jgi:hydroxypyruvate isomerase
VIDFSLCLETGFADNGLSFPDRVRASADAGFSAVEIWDWRDKPLRELGVALHETGTRLHTLCVEDWRDKCQLGDPASHEEFVSRVSQAAEVAADLGVGKLVVLAGDIGPHIEIDAQLAAARDALARASDAIAAQPVELLVEVVNREFEGPNALLQDSRNALQLLRELIGHVQAADVPGRREFGTGTQDWTKEFGWLLAAGYDGYVGIEAILISELHAVLAEAHSLVECAQHPIPE